MDCNIVRLLRAEEIECRMATVSEKGVSLLLYKDARVDQKILDETFGAFGWKRSHQCIDGNLYCTVEIYDKESGIWVSKQDVGTMGNAEKEKSQASDSFKRACFNWGIGRELYTAPFIWIPAGKAVIRKEGERIRCFSRFSVHSIGYNREREIDFLEITDEKNALLYEYRMGNNAAAGKNDQKNVSETEWAALKEELQRTGVTMDEVFGRYHIRGKEEFSSGLYSKAMKALANTKSAERKKSA